MDFSNRIISARKSKGLSQEALADLIGVSRQAVSKWETGDAKPDLDKTITLCKALDLSMDYLCLGKESSCHELPTVPPAPEGKKDEHALKNIQRLLQTLLATVVIIVFCFICVQIQQNTSTTYLPQTGHLTNAQGVLNSYTIHSVRVEPRGTDLLSTIEISVAYMMDDMEMQVILESENNPNMAPVILEPTFENGIFYAAIPFECYQQNFRVRALLTLLDAQRSIPLISGLRVDETGCTYEPLPIP